MLEVSFERFQSLQQCLAGSGVDNAYSHVAFVQYVLANGMLIWLAFWHVLDMCDTVRHVQLGPGSRATGSASSNSMGYSGAQCQCMGM